MYLQELLDNVDVSSKGIHVYTNNTSAIHQGENLQSSTRSKHIRRRYHFNRELIQQGEIKLGHIDGKHNIADMMTKSLEGKAFEYLRILMLTEDVEH